MKIALVVLASAFVVLGLVPLLAVPDGAPAAGPMLGEAATARWTETTVKAASKPENKATLDKGKVATVTGELVDVSCYLQLGKRGEAHIPCGSDCVRNGQPAGIVDASGKLYILMIEEHDPRRLGQIKVTDQLASMMSKTVTATGMLEENNGYNAIYVQGTEIAAMKPLPPPPPPPTKP